MEREKYRKTPETQVASPFSGNEGRIQRGIITYKCQRVSNDNQGGVVTFEDLLMDVATMTT